jgi:hypothetical protein
MPVNNDFSGNDLKIILKRNFKREYFYLLKNLYLWFFSLPFGFELDMLARIYKSDKFGKHFYTRHYQTHFRKLKFKRIKLFEIGAGGYHHPDIGGNSLRMWKRYFPFGKIFSLDIYDKSCFDEHRIKIFQGDQTDSNLLERIIGQIGEPDIIIDDGSHINTHVIRTFEILYPKLKTGGIYVIEDTQTSYWPDYGGDSENLDNPSTMMNYFKKLTDCLNHQEFVKSNYIASFFDKNIYSIQFYHNLIFIFKEPNSESSSVDFGNPSSIIPDALIPNHPK